MKRRSKQNTNMKTQRDIVEEKLRKEGAISNVWAFEHRILRLGAWIYRLRQEGWIINTNYENRKGMRNCRYVLVSE